MKKILFKLGAFLGAFTLLSSSIKADLITPGIPVYDTLSNQAIIGIIVVCCLAVISVILLALAALVMLRRSKNKKARK